MPDNDLFSGGDNSENVIDPSKNYFEELVGEGKKFVSPEDLAKGKAESDIFIMQLQKENKEMRDVVSEQQKELETRSSVEDNLKKFIDTVDSKDHQQTTNFENKPNQGEPQNNGEEFKGITKDDVLDLLNSRERQKTAEENFNHVQTSLVKLYGEHWQKEVENKRDQLNLGQDFMNNLAREQPSAFLALMEKKEQVSEVNTQTLFASGDVDMSTNRPSNVSGGMTWNQLEKMRKEDPSSYFTPQVQNYIYAQVERYGDEFKQT